jgi:hypothetical protein
VEKQTATFKKYKNMPELLRGMGHMAALVGTSGDKIAVPKEDSPPAVLAQFREALGVPETPAGYGITKPDQLPEGLEWNQEAVDAFTALAHKHNAPTALVKELLALDTTSKAAQLQSSVAQQEAASAQARTEGLAELKKDWGADTDAQLVMAKRMAIKEGIDLEDPALSSPTTVRLLAKMAKMVREDQLPLDIKDQTTMNQSEAMRIMTDKGHPDYVRYHSGQDKALMLRVQNMLRNGG